jgi:hypothetical protein
MFTDADPEQCCLDMGSTAVYIAIKWIQEIKGEEYTVFS